MSEKYKKNILNLNLDLSGFNLSSITNAHELYSYIELILNDYLQNIIMLGLIDKNFTQVLTDGTKYKFVVSGDKAINNILSNNILKIASGFDINLITNESRKDDCVNDFCNKLTLITNDEYLDNKFKISRNYLESILLNGDLISPSESSHYINEPLFYYFRNNIFIHLKLKNNLFQDGRYYSNDSDNSNPSFNEIYFPILRISSDNLNFLHKYIESPCAYLYEKNNLTWVGLPLILYNLINNTLSLTFNGELNEFEKKILFNVKTKLEYLLDVENYSSWLMYPRPDLSSQFDKFKEDYISFESLSSILDLSFKELINIEIQSDLTLNNIFNHISKNFNEKIDSIITNINSKILLANNGKCSESDETRIFFDNTRLELLKHIKKMNTVTNKMSNTRISIDQTMITELNSQMNSHGWLKNNFQKNNFNPIKAFVEQELYRLLREYQKNRYFHNVEEIPSIEFCNDYISNSISSYTREIGEVLSYIRDDIYLYRIQSFECFNLEDGSIFNLPTLQKNDVIVFPEFLSTSYSRCFKFKPFLNPTGTYILKIVINKNLPSWLYIGNFSDVIFGESEVLLNKNLYFKVVSVQYENIKSGSNDMDELPVITLIPYINLEDALSSVGQTHLINPDYISESLLSQTNTEPAENAALNALGLEDDDENDAINALESDDDDFAGGSNYYVKYLKYKKKYIELKNNKFYN